VGALQRCHSRLPCDLLRPHSLNLEGNPNKEAIMSEKKTIKLPSGAQVVLKDPKSLRVKDRRKVFNNAAGQEGLMMAMSLTDGLISVLVESWSLDLIIPSVRIESIDEMEMADYDTLAEEIKDAEKILFPNLSKSDETEADPESPIEASND
jgi:hypothetical protein